MANKTRPGWHMSAFAAITLFVFATTIVWLNLASWGQRISSSRSTPVKAVISQLVTPGFPVSQSVSGWYDNSLRSIIGNVTKENELIAWYRRNRADSSIVIGLYGFNSIHSNPALPSFVRRAFDAGIRLFVPYTTNSEVTNVLNYNARQSDQRCKIVGATTEFEPYNHDPNRDGVKTWNEIHLGDSIFIKLLLDNTPRLNAAGLFSGVYTGWHNDSLYKFIVKYCDVLYITCYRPSDKMEVAADAFGYLCGYTDVQRPTDYASWGRLTKYARECELQYKGIHAVVLQSCEPSFGRTYFSTSGKNMPWGQYVSSFMNEWNTKASPRMKKWIWVDSKPMTFVSEEGKKCKS